MKQFVDSVESPATTSTFSVSSSSAFTSRKTPLPPSAWKTREWERLSPVAWNDECNNSGAMTPQSTSFASTLSATSSSSFFSAAGAPSPLSDESRWERLFGSEEEPPPLLARKRLPDLPPRIWLPLPAPLRAPPGFPEPAVVVAVVVAPVAVKKDDDDDDERENRPPPIRAAPGAKQVPPVVLAPKPAQWPMLAKPVAVAQAAPFFGDASFDFATLVVGPDAKCSTAFPSAKALVQARLSLLRQVANLGFGVVPIMNSFTIENSSTKVVGGTRRALSVASSSSLRTCFSPEPSELDHLVLYQIGLPSGRQGLFQGVSRTLRGGKLIESLVGELVVIEQDDGVEIGLLRGFERLSSPVPGIPEVPFMRILKQADKSELAKLELKRGEEAKVLAMTRLAKITALAPALDVQFCEFQFDRKKLVVFTCMTDFVDFREYVTALHAMCDVHFGYAVRVFVQRKFLASNRSRVARAAPVAAPVAAAKSVNF